MLQGKGIDCLATHPGLAATPLYPKLDKSKPEAVAVNLFEKVYPALWCLQQGVKSHSVLAGGGLCIIPPSCAGVLCVIHLRVLQCRHAVCQLHLTCVLSLPSGIQANGLMPMNLMFSVMCASLQAG